MSDTPADPVRAAVESALLRVARNVAKHTIQRDGWHEQDPCFLIDLRESEEEIMAVVADAIRKAAGGRT